MSWGHEAGNNNCTRSQAERRLRGVWKSGRPLLFHKADFDLDVAEVAFNLPRPPWHMWFCSMIEAFLYDPNEQKLGLKELAEKHLGMPPEERDAVREWLIKHKIVSRQLKKEWAAYIWKAPGDLVGSYAIGDVVRTRKLHDFFIKWINEVGMQKAYERERRVMPVLLGMSRRGVSIDSPRLEKSVKVWEDSAEISDRWIRKRLRSPDLNIGSTDDLADAIEKRGLVDEWIMTDHATNPKRSTAMEALEIVLKDVELYSVLRYRASLRHSLVNNVRPWLELVDDTGRIYYEWNQVRQANTQKRRSVGARTGRLSTSPNMQNIANMPMVIVYSKEEFEAAKAAFDREDAGRPLMMPKDLLGKLCPLPWMREFIISTKGRYLMARDYAQQELRILAHFMGGEVLRLYRENPGIDFHMMATEGLNKLLNLPQARWYPRKIVKQIVLAIIYARGIAALAEQLSIPVEEAGLLRKSIKQLFPGVKTLEDTLKRRAALDQPARTWGGRVFYCEPPREIKGKWRTFAYKMINTLIQGSAADNTKEAMIRYDEIKKDGELDLQIHDELLGNAPKSKAGFRSEMKLLREAMESVEFDVPMLTDGEAGPTWGQMQDYNDMREAA
jgi:DNA polymerase I-like protein with 3'-5' exonuclease and polymerase domains